MMYAKPDSELSTKSAFSPDIYENMPLDIYMPGIDTATQLLKSEKIMPKLYQIHDIYMAHYKPYETVYRSLKQSNKAAPAWRMFVESLIRSPNFIELNNITNGSMELAAAAAARTFTKIAQIQTQTGQTLEEVIRGIDDNNGRPGGGLEIQKAGGVDLQVLMGQISEAVGQAVGQVIEELREYIEARREAEAAAAMLAGGYGYSLEGLSIWSFLENPDELRRRVRLLSAAALALRQISRSLPTSLSHAYTESMWGGIDGVTKMQSYTQLPDVLPSELALREVCPTLFAAKLAQMNLSVHRRAAAVKPILFIDKSGSMDAPLEGTDTPKISLAAGLAIAIYRRFGGEIYLFDTEVDKVDPKGVVKTLLSIRADGGTMIDAVLEEIMRIDRRDQIYIIVSDGITEASEDTLRRRFKVAKRTRLILVGEEGYNWVKAIGRVIKATDIAGFMAAARQALAP